MKILARRTVALMAVLVVHIALAEGSAIAPKCLYSVTEANEETKVKPEKVVTISTGGAVSVAGSNAVYPCVDFVPANGVWDLSPWGHIETQVKNTSDMPISVNMRVDQTDPFQSNTEIAYLKPGESRMLKVIFGYQYGFKPGPKLDPSKIKLVKLFVGGKSDKTRTFTFTDIFANGPSGEKPPLNPNHVVTVPEGGVMVPMKKGTEKNLSTFNDAKAVFTKSGTVAVTLGEREWGAVRVKPAMGSWNLGSWLKVKAVVKNTSGTAISPRMKIDGGEAIETDETPIAPGKIAVIEKTFFAPKSWCAKEGQGTLPGCQYKFESHRVKGVVFSAKGQRKTFEILEIKAEDIIAELPGWLGKKPPVPGDWKLVWHDEFNGKALNTNDWEIYTANYWDKRTHFTKDNVFLRDGNAVLKYEKKTGHQNDDPSAKTTDYACGFLSTYGMKTWTYGYFEARMKLPTAPGLWPAFWTMPDRGADKGPQWVRADTWKGGMEFDVMEHLTAWGPHRFNIACHWDGYGKGHKSVGTSGAYLPADKDGYIVVGFLWLPGQYVVYGNGVEIGRLESSRICNVPSYVILYMVSGGWANVPIEDEKLPDEFQIDWIRVWQREDMK